MAGHSTPNKPCPQDATAKAPLTAADWAVAHGYLNRICSVMGFNMTHLECLLLSDLNKDLTTKPTCQNLKNSELCKAKAAFRKNETADCLLHIYSVFTVAMNTNYCTQTIYLL